MRPSPHRSSTRPGRRAVRVTVLPVLTLCLAATAVPVGALPAQARADHRGPVADLRVDANRDGVTDMSPGRPADDAGEDRPKALFLPNLDDDRNRCRERSADGALLPDPVLAGCNDASDAVVNGPLDALDLARVRTVPASRTAPGTVGRLTVAPAGRVGVFVRRGTGWSRVTESTRFTADELRAGLDIGVEGRDVVRDRSVWDGTITLRLTVTAGTATATDSARMTLAPMLAHTTTQRPLQVLTADPRAAYTPQRATEQRRFVTELTSAVAAAGVPRGVRRLAGPEMLDPWVQDTFEPMYASMPTAGGVRSVRLLLRSDQTRPSGSALYALRGHDVGVVWMGPRGHDSSRDSFGNLETVPAYRHGGRSYPAGRLVYGVAPGAPASENLSDRAVALLRAQRVQDPIAVDTSFLYVGHVDEMMQFVPADTPRGWRVAVTDPRAGLRLLRDAKRAGRGSATVVDHSGETITVEDALRPGTAGVVDDNLRAARIIDANLATIMAATGVTGAEVIRVPGLYVEYSRLLLGQSLAAGPASGGSRGALVPDAVAAARAGALRTGAAGLRAARTGAAAPREMVALVPGAINGIVLGRTVVVPKQFGVKVAGRDIFTDAVTAAYRSAGLTPRFVDGWFFHRGFGEVHCATNTLRDSDIAWWRRR